MVSDGGVEAVIIGTPHPVHAEHAVAAAKTGAHILVEKPLASSLEDCDAIIKAAKEKGVVLCTICQRWFYHPLLENKAGD